MLLMQFVLHVWKCDHLLECYAAKFSRKCLPLLPSSSFNRNLIKFNSKITNLSNVEWQEDEIEILKVCLKHGLLIRPRESYLCLFYILKQPRCVSSEFVLCYTIWIYRVKMAYWWWFRKKFIWWIKYWKWKWWNGIWKW